jgi:APA family basic amino acid/polyamine antiporter
MLGLPGSAWERLAIWLVIGFGIYFLYGRRRALAVRAAQRGRAAVAAGAR